MAFSDFSGKTVSPSLDLEVTSIAQRATREVRKYRYRRRLTHSSTTIDRIIILFVTALSTLQSPSNLAAISKNYSMRLNKRNILRALLPLAASSFILSSRGVDANLEVMDECPTFTEQQDCVKVGSYREFRDVVQNEKPEGELVLCPFDIQLSQDDKVTWVKTDLHLMCQQLNKCTIRDGAYQIKVHGTNQVTVQGFNFIGATHSAFRVWEKTPKLQKVCHCNFER